MSDKRTDRRDQGTVAGGNKQRGGRIGLMYLLWTMREEERILREDFLRWWKIPEPCRPCHRQITLARATRQTEAW
jgi:hypothetical protein